MNLNPSHAVEDVTVETPTISSVEAKYARGETVNVNAGLNERNQCCVKVEQRADRR